MSIRLVELPMPPSANKAWAPFPFKCKATGRLKASLRPTREAQLYEKRFESWSLAARGSNIEKLRRIISTWVDGGNQIRIDSFFYFPRKSIVTQDGKPKGFDVFNMTKVLHDEITKIISIDDRHFVSGWTEKLASKSDAEEYVNVKMEPYTWKV